MPASEPFLPPVQTRMRPASPDYGQQPTPAPELRPPELRPAELRPPAPPAVAPPPMPPQPDAVAPLPPPLMPPPPMSPLPFAAPPVPPPAATQPAPPPAAQAPAPAPEAKPSVARGALPADLARKLELEAAMAAAPQDKALRTAYFDHLGRIAISHTGLQTAALPELGVPLFFRCGTPDIAVLANIFRDEAQAFEMAPTPLRILVIGAYAGYATVDLARRFPRAQILAAEPLPDNFRLLSLNTGAWKRIRCANVALWHHATTLAPPMRFQADWAVRLHDEALSEDCVVPAVSVADLLAQARWPDVDMIVCDASGSEREVFANPMSPWLIALDAVLVRLHEQVAPRATEWVNAALPPAVFEHRKVGDMELYVRRIPRRALPPRPPELPLLRTDPGLTPFGLDVPQAGFAFFVFDGNNCQVHPGPPGGKPSRAVFTVRANGQHRFVSGIEHAGRGAGAVTFVAAVQREDGAVAGRGEVELKSGKSGRLAIELGEPLTGTVRVALQTAMAPGAPHANMAWARWLDPKLI